MNLRTFTYAYLSSEYLFKILSKFCFNFLLDFCISLIDFRGHLYMCIYILTNHLQINILQIPYLTLWGCLFTLLLEEFYVNVV